MRFSGIPMVLKGVEMFDRSVVDEVVDKIVETFSPEKVILFGSVAKGTADEFSDLDLLVVMDTDKQPHERSVPVYLAVASIHIPKDILVLTPEEFERTRDDEYSFTSEIVKTGVVVFEARKSTDERIRHTADLLRTFP